MARYRVHVPDFIYRTLLLFVTLWWLTFVGRLRLRYGCIAPDAPVLLLTLVITGYRAARAARVTVDVIDYAPACRSPLFDRAPLPPDALPFPICLAAALPLPLPVPFAVRTCLRL